MQFNSVNKIVQLATVLVLSLGLVACGGSDPATNAEETESHQKSPTLSKENQYSNTGTKLKAPRSWQDIKRSGYIRALKLAWESENHLPRTGSTSLFHRQLLTDFARFHDLEVRWVMVNNFTQMFDALLNFQADIIPRHLTITDERQKRVAFTQSLSTDNEVLVGTKKVASQDLNKPIISVPNDSSYIGSIKAYLPDAKIEFMQKTLSSDDLADALIAGDIQYTIMDQSALDTLLTYRSDVTAIQEFPETRFQAWALNQHNYSFLQELNEYIAAHHVLRTANRTRTVDLDVIKSKPYTLRMITRNSPETYFMWRGELMGFEYDLMKEFADRQKVNLEIIVADEFEEMLQLLNEGKGDVIAAGISRTEKRKKELNFSIRYNRVDEKIVANRNNAKIESKEDLKGRTIWVRQSSAFWDTAQQLKHKYGAKVKAADESISTELLIAEVARGNIDLTIADSNLVNIEESFRQTIYSPITLNEGIPWAYITRKNNPKLLNALNRYIGKEYRQTFYNVIKNKYFANQRQQQEHRKERISEGSALSPFDPIVKQNAKPFNFDWRLIVAQMYQESRFNPNAKSHAGARGLMQVLPRTAEELGYSNLNDPEESIAAGIEYLDWTRDRFDNDLPVEERLYFALAAYNAGYGHVKDAQKLAKKLQLNPNKWFNNVELAMLKLQYPEYYKQTRFGYCRGSEPVAYVREIQQRYLNYVNIAK